MAELQPLRDNANLSGHRIPRKPLAASYSPLKDATRTEITPDFSVDDHIEHAQTQTQQQQPLQQSTKQQKRPRASWIYRVYNYSWLIEIASLVLAFVAFGATIITLAIHQGKTLPNWPQAISINSLIAIFTAVLKAAMILPVSEGLGQIKWSWFRKTRALVDLDRIDAATRGPWGSFLLIMTWFRNYLALLGAIITVVALAIDPFSQQVLEYRNCDQVVNGKAFVSTSDSYWQTGGSQSATRDLVDRDMESAIYSALYATPASSTSNVQFTCESSNCTFPGDGTATYMSLAMCSKCEDLTSSITKTKVPWMNSTGSTGLPVDLNYTLQARFGPNMTGSSLTIQGSSNTSTIGSDVWLSIVSMDMYDYEWGDTWWTSAFNTLMWSNCSCIGEKPAGFPLCSCTPFAAKCTMYPCVKTYNATVKKGVLQETEVPNPAVPQEPTAKITDIVFVVNETIRKGKRYPCSTSSSESPEYPISRSFLLPDDGSHNMTTGYEWYPEGCLWQFGQKSQTSLVQLFSKTIWTSGLTAMNGERSPSKLGGTVWAQKLFNNGSANIDTVNTYIKGLTDTMTGIIRRNGLTSPSMQVNGVTTQSQTCISVRWAWLSLPASLLVLATIFLTTVIWTIGKGDTAVWKSSPLALLFHGLDPNFKDEYSSLMDLQSMEDTAKSVDVRMEPRDQGYRFVVK